MRNFRNYDVWIDGVDFSVDIYKITENFPKKETYALCDQMQRAAVSIPSNIAEGCSRKSVNEFAHFLEFSLGSSYEVETQLLISKNIGYINLNIYEQLHDEIISIEKQLAGFISAVRK